MRFLRRLLFFTGFIGAILSVVLLLNFTASNPTGRRYSSENVPTYQEVGLQKSGQLAEQVLSKDLQAPHNNTTGGAQQCICSSSFMPSSSPKMPGCQVCSVYATTIRRESFFVPDFVTVNYVGESKNTRLFPPSDDLDQLHHFVMMATTLKMPLWVYVRQDTQIDQAFASMIAQTGGGVLPYFTYPGYIDPVDLSAWRGLALSLVLIVLPLALELRPHRRPVRGGGKPKSPRTPAEVMQEAHHKTDELQRFKDRATERAKHRIDIEDSRNE